jgi:hypothetical protein
MKKLAIGLVAVLVVGFAAAAETNTFNVSVSVVTANAAEWRGLADSMSPLYTEQWIFRTNSINQVSSNKVTIVVAENAREKIKRCSARFVEQMLQNQLERAKAQKAIKAVSAE